MKSAQLLLTIALAGTASIAVASEDPIALFKNVAGPVEVVRKGSTLPAAAGMNLLASDRVLAGAGASAGITFRDGARIAVGPSSEVHLREYVFKPKDGQYAFDLYLAKGSALYSSGKLAKASPEAVKIATPTATVGVRGTRFIVEAN